jgi:hypothetical protein
LVIGVELRTSVPNEAGLCTTLYKLPKGSIMNNTSSPSKLLMPYQQIFLFSCSSTAKLAKEKLSW